MKLVDGENKIRIVTPTYYFRKHNSQEGGKFKSVICIGENCPLCAEGDRAKSRYAWVIIDRKDGQAKILEVGWSVYEQMLSLAKDEEYGDLNTYDLKIKKSGEGLGTSYAVVASPKKTDITKAELDLVGKADIDLDKVFGGGKYTKKEEPEVKEPFKVSLAWSEKQADLGDESDMPDDFLTGKED